MLHHEAGHHAHVDVANRGLVPNIEALVVTLNSNRCVEPLDDAPFSILVGVVLLPLPMRLDPAQAARVDGSAAATSHTVKTDPCAWCSVMVRSPNLRSTPLEQHKHQKWVLLAVRTNVPCVQN